MSRRRQTVVYAEGGGRFGNQFLRLAHWVAWSRDVPDVRIVPLAFWPYARCVERWRENPGCSFPEHDQALDRLARLAGRVPPRWMAPMEWRARAWFVRGARRMPFVDVVSLDDPAGEALELAPTTFRDAAPVVVCSGWRFQCWETLERRAEEVRTLLRPPVDERERARARVDRIRATCDVVVGVLARKGDYARWAAGRFDYPWEEYHRWVAQCDRLFPGARVGVLLTGDERIPSAWAEWGDVHLGSGSVNLGGSWFDSFLELAACDAIVSPPSTFAACAGFLGRVPLVPLRRTGQVLGPGDLLQGHLFDAHRDADFAWAVQ